MKNYRDYRRVWVKGHYRKTEIETPEGKKKVRKWCEGYWRKIKIKQKEAQKDE